MKNKIFSREALLSLIGVFLGSLFMYLSIKEVDYEDFISSFNNVRFSLIGLSIFLVTLGLFLRSLRFAVMLRSLEEINQKTLFPITCFGFAASAIVPLKIGELARPLLISNKSNISFSSCLAVLIVERIFDSLAILTFFFISVSYMNLDIISKLGFFPMITVLFVLILFILVLLYKKDLFFRLLTNFLQIFPINFRENLERLFQNLILGFGAISNLKTILITAFLTIIIWLIAALLIYILYSSVGINLIFLTSFVVLFVVSVGIAIPAAPGYVGNWQYACIFALAIFSIDKADSLAFSLVYYAMALVPVMVIGLLCFPLLGIKYDDMKKLVKSKTK